MYKVFFQDRIVKLTDNFTKDFEQNYGLFYKFNNRKELSEILQFFELHTAMNRLVIFHIDLIFLWEEFKKCFRYIEAAGGLVRNRKGNILIIKRRGKWDLPKGKAKKGEDIEETAIREVSEECGIPDLEIKSPLKPTYHTYRLDSEAVLKKTYWFEMACSEGNNLKPQLQEDITEAVWIDPNNIKMVFNNTFPAIADVLNESLPG